MGKQPTNVKETNAERRAGEEEINKVQINPTATGERNIK